MPCHETLSVAKGFNQKPGLDYVETYAPVDKLVTTNYRIILTVDVLQGFLFHQIDLMPAAFMMD